MATTPDKSTEIVRNPEVESGLSNRITIGLDNANVVAIATIQAQETLEATWAAKLKERTRAVKAAEAKVDKLQAELNAAYVAIPITKLLADAKQLLTIAKRLDMANKDAKFTFARTPDLKTKTLRVSVTFAGLDWSSHTGRADVVALPDEVIALVTKLDAARKALEQALNLARAAKGVLSDLPRTVARLEKKATANLAYHSLNQTEEGRAILDSLTTSVGAEVDKLVARELAKEAEAQAEADGVEIEAEIGGIDAEDD